jgi:hypothetical protein
MPTFIDESGDTGHSHDSLSYFRMAAVWVPDRPAADAIRSCIRVFRQHQGLAPTFEFKFTRASPELRTLFFETIASLNFRFAVCAIDKSRGEWTSASASAQHWASATSLAALLRPLYRQAETGRASLGESIIVDDNGDRRFLAAVGSAFRGLRSCYFPNIPLVANPRFRNSRSDEMLQLADMICGAFGAAINGNCQWFDRLHSRSAGRIDLP